MKKIIATAPTVYQYKSLTYFGMPIEDLPDGSFQAEQEFDSEQEAKEFLTQRAEMYFETEEELKDAIEDIKTYGILRLDAASAHIE